MKRCLCVSLAIIATACIAFGAPPPLPHSKVNIVVSGSSTVWGRGLLDDGLVGPIDDYIKNSLSTTVMSSNMTYTCSDTNTIPEEFLSKKLYKGIGHTITGIGSAVEFELSGDELAICQVIQRTSNWAKLGVFADGKRIATLVNKNHTLGQEQISFMGDGKCRIFELERPFTYNHKITINGKTLTGKIHAGRIVKQEVFKKYPEKTALRSKPTECQSISYHGKDIGRASKSGLTM